LSEAQLYRHLRQEELLAYRHVVRCLAMVGTPDTLGLHHRRLLEDVEDLFHIPPKRCEAERALAFRVDPVIQRVRAQGVVSKRDRFADEQGDGEMLLAPDGSDSEDLDTTRIHGGGGGGGAKKRATTQGQPLTKVAPIDYEKKLTRIHEDVDQLRKKVTAGTMSLGDFTTECTAKLAELKKIEKEIKEAF